MHVCLAAMEAKSTDYGLDCAFGIFRRCASRFPTASYSMISATEVKGTQS